LQSFGGRLGGRYAQLLRKLHSAELAEDASASLPTTAKHMITTPLCPPGERAIEYDFAVQADPSRLTMQPSLTGAAAQSSHQKLKGPENTHPELYPSSHSHMRQSG